MTVQPGNSANLHSGMKQFGQTTNSYGGFFTSNGSALSLPIPFLPDKFEFWNYTKFGTDTNNIEGVWLRGFPAAAALIINRATTTLTSTLATTNGVTLVTSGGTFASEQLSISSITAATPGVVTTSANHGYASGQRVIITQVQGTMAQSVNNMTFVVQVLSATTFGLYDVFGFPYTTVGTATGSTGQSTLTGPALNIHATPAAVSLTLGTSIIGANNDVIYFEATQMNAYYNLGGASTIAP